ncbi:MAG: hypothetical protein ACKPKO_65995, partial [Candidatus Fonsibacter sp.]
DQNLTIYSVSLLYSYQNFVYTSTQNVIYQPEDATAPIPDPSIVKSKISPVNTTTYIITRILCD